MARVKEVDRRLKRIPEGAPGPSHRSLLKKLETERKNGRRRGSGSIDGSQPSSPIIEGFKGEDNDQAGQVQPPSQCAKCCRVSARPHGLGCVNLLLGQYKSFIDYISDFSRSEFSRDIKDEAHNSTCNVHSRYLINKL